MFQINCPLRFFTRIKKINELKIEIILLNYLYNLLIKFHHLCTITINLAFQDFIVHGQICKNNNNIVLKR